MPDAVSPFTDLSHLLRRRVEVIADHAWRDRDAESHLAALIAVSTEISAWEAGRTDPVPPRLRHYLQNCSYEKALDWLESDRAQE